MARYISVARCFIEPATTPVDSSQLGLRGSPSLLAPLTTPSCADCGQDMAFIAQIPLRTILPLARTWDMAYIYCCPGEFDDRNWLKCHNWEPGSGCNAVILQRADEGEHPSHASSGGPEFAMEWEIITQPDTRTLAAIENDEIEWPEGMDEEDLVWDGFTLGEANNWFQEEDLPPCPACGGPTVSIATIPASIARQRPLTAEDRKRILYQVLSNPDISFDPPEQVTLPFCGAGFVSICEKECGAHGAAFLWQPD